MVLDGFKEGVNALTPEIRKIAKVVCSFMVEIICLWFCAENVIKVWYFVRMFVLENPFYFCWLKCVAAERVFYV
jgi:hypothetical protein